MSEQPVSPSLKEQLVAYLDGELDDASAREVESLLSTDPRAREALRQLETAWDLLEELPRAEVSQSFTESTIEIVAISLEKDLEQEQAARPRRELRNWGLAAAAVLAASLVGFAAVASLTADPNERLLRDLPLLARLDEYRQIDDLQFLRELQTANLLKDMQPQAEQPTSLADRRMLVEHMTAAEKEELQEKQQRFSAFLKAEQGRLRRLHDELQMDAEAPQLRGAMSAYYEWFLKLSPPQRASLASADTSARVEKVKSLRAEEVRRTADRAEPEDLETIAAWLESHIYERMLPDRKAATDALEAGDRRGAIMLWAMLSPRLPGSPPRQPELNATTIAELREKLSPAGKAKLDALDSEEAQRRVLIGREGWDGWTSQAMRDSVRRYFEALIADVPEEDLVAFFEQLPEKDRDELQKMSSDYKDHRLRLMYVLAHRKERLPDHVRGMKPEMFGWLRWGRGDNRWPGGYRGRDGGRGDGPPFLQSPPDGRPGLRRQ